MTTHVKVYFEVIGSHSELVAIFANESIYNDCLPELEARAQERGMVVTESVCEDLSLDDINQLYKAEAKRLEHEQHIARVMRDARNDIDNICCNG